MADAPYAPPMRPGNPGLLARLHGLGDGLLNGLTDEQLALLDELGGPVPTPDTSQETLPQQSGASQFFQGFAGLENQPQAQPRGFAQGLIGGLSRGLGSAGSRIEMERAKLEQGVKARQAAKDLANRDATQRFYNRQDAIRSALVGDVVASGREGRAETRAKMAAEAARENKLTDTAALNKEWDRRFGKEQAARTAEARTKTKAPKPPTEFQARAGFFGARANEASQGAVKDGLESRMLNKAWDLQAPVWSQRDPGVREYWRAMESFALALNRLESGAAISPTEFSKVRALYFVAPGDKEADIKQKQVLRKTVVEGLQKMQGPGAAETSEVSPETPRAVTAASLWEP